MTNLAKSESPRQDNRGFESHAPALNPMPMGVTRRTFLTSSTTALIATGCGLSNRCAGQGSPAESGVEKTDQKTGRVQVLILVQGMAEIPFPQGQHERTHV